MVCSIWSMKQAVHFKRGKPKALSDADIDELAAVLSRMLRQVDGEHAVIVDMAILREHHASITRASREHHASITRASR